MASSKNSVEMRKKLIGKVLSFLIRNTGVVTKNSYKQTQMKFNKVDKVWPKFLLFLRYLQ